MKSTDSLSTKIMEHLSNPVVRTATVVKAKVIALATDYLRKDGFVELLPTMISPITDPLNHEVFNAHFEYYNQEYRLTQSMIFHKQLAMTAFDKIFIVSPNVRLETAEKKSTGRHLFEFAQIDMEMRGAKREDVMNVIEGLFVNVVSGIKTLCANELKFLGANPLVPAKPFPKVKYLDAFKEYGPDFENILSMKHTEPFWLIDIPIYEREFYDKLSEDGETLSDMDLILPFGYGETLSGGEREHEFGTILKRMEYKKTDPKELGWYMDIAEEGLLVPSAGCGFGVERLTRYICGLQHASQTRLFPKIPGEPSI